MTEKGFLFIKEEIIPLTVSFCISLTRLSLQAITNCKGLRESNYQSKRHKITTPGLSQ